MINETIDTDVSAEDQVEGQQPVVTPEAPAAAESQLSRRDQKMKDIAEKRKAERDAGTKAAALMADPELSDDEYDAKLAARNEPDSQHAESTEQEEATPAENGEAGHPPAAEEHSSKTRKLKVNGQLVELSEADYERHLSKDLAGDQKLRQAAEAERSIRQREQDLERREAALRQPPKPPGSDAPDVDAAIDGYVEAIYSGDADAAKQKLKLALAAGRQTSTPNIEELVKQAVTRDQQSRDIQRRNENAQEGWQAFSSEYAEIATDDVKIAAADVHLKKVLAENPELSPKDAILEAGKRTRAMFSPPRDVSNPTAKHTDASRIDRKAQLTRVPKSGTPAARAEAPQIDMSTKAKIQRARAARAV